MGGALAAGDDAAEAAFLGVDLPPLALPSTEAAARALRERRGG